VVKKKLKEYSKKKKRDTSLEFLEYSSSLGLESEEQVGEREPNLVPNPRLEDEYMLPKLPKPPSSF
jgi:hypothetical protein